MKTLAHAKAVLSALLLLAAPLAHAHLPICQCQAQNGQVLCQGGYSDGSAAFDTPIQVIDFEENVLVSGRLDEQSRFSFQVPDGNFYVFMDGGVGHTVEVDMEDIEGL